jgi:CRP-like cAMP-binding protein
VHVPAAAPKPGWPHGNLILSALPAEEREAWRPHLNTVEVRAGESLYHVSDQLTWVYFPLDCVVAAIGISRHGATAEYATLGSEGIVGLNAFLGDSRAGGHALVVLPGRAWRLPAPPLRETFEHSNAFRSVILRYAASRVFQISQTSLCQAHHSVEQRLSRWLLQLCDRVAADELPLTHERVAIVHGVRREAVTIAFKHLQALGVLRARRGCIWALDRARLEGLSCECYADLRQDVDLLEREIALLRPQPPRRR